MIQIPKCALVAALVLVAGPTPISAAIVSYSFAGSFAGEFGTIAAGTAVTGEFSYQLPQPANDANPTSESYLYESASFRVGTSDYITTSGLLTVRDGTYGRDDFQLELDRNIVVGGISLAEYGPLHIVLHDLDQLIFASDALPDVLPDLSEFESPRINATSTAQSQSNVDFRINITELVKVPEPTSFTFAVLGAVLLAGIRVRN